MYFDFNTNGQAGTPVQGNSFSAQSPITPKAAPFNPSVPNRTASVNPAPVQSPIAPQPEIPVAAPAPAPTLSTANDSFIEGWDDELDENSPKQAVNIKVFGVGGGGNNAVNRMYLNGEENADFVVINTDIPILRSSPVPTKLGIGRTTTKGHGAGANPEVGKAAAEESIEHIKAKLENVDMLYITAGMGGGTGTGASPVIARVAKEMGILTVAVVTKPFAFEGASRMAVAEDGIAKLRQFVDAVIVVPNEKLNTLSNKPLGLKEAFKAADEILIKGVQSICSLINDESYINLDFADVTTILRNSGEAHIGIGIASGENKAMLAAEQAINSPLLETSINDADGMIISVNADENVAVNEISDAINSINKNAAKNVRIIWGLKFDPNMGDRIEITVIATKSGMVPQEPQFTPEPDPQFEVAQTVSTASSPFAGTIAEDPTPATAIPVTPRPNPIATPAQATMQSPPPAPQPNNIPYGATPGFATPAQPQATPAQPAYKAAERPASQEPFIGKDYFEMIRNLATNAKSKNNQ